MNEPFDPASAALMLREAFRNGEPLTELPPANRPSTISQGYDVQDRLVGLLDDDAVGWKLALGSAKGVRTTGEGRAIAGRILRNRLYGPGDVVPVPPGASAAVEFEVAFVLGRDVHPGEPLGDPVSVVAETRVAFELILSRFVDRGAVGWPSFTADNAAFGALVLGHEVDFAAIEAMRASLRVLVDGEEMAGALSGDDEVDPVQALRDLLSIAGERGTTLLKGSIVSTGTVSRPFPITAPAKVLGVHDAGELSFSIASK